MPLASGQRSDPRLAAAFSPHVQLGREPALAAPRRFNVCPIPDSLVPARTSRVLMGADDGRVHDVQVPTTSPRASACNASRP